MNLIENNNKQNAILNTIANLDVDKSQEKPIQQVKWNPEEVSEKQVDKAVKSISKDLKTSEDSVKSALEKDPKDLTNEIKDFKNSDNNKKLRDSYLGQRAVDNNKFGYAPFEVLGYGRVENMIIKGNILNISTDISKYKLKDFKNRLFPVFYDGINTHILNYENFERNNLKNCIIRLDFYDESYEEIIKIIKSYQ